MPTSTLPSPPNSTPELLYLLHGDRADLADALSGMRAADIADDDALGQRSLVVADRAEIGEAAKVP